MLVVFALLLAEVPGGHFYLGVGGFAGGHNGFTKGPSVEAQLEFGHFIIGANYLDGHTSGRFATGGEDFAELELRAAYVFSDDDIAPYVGPGFAWGAIGAIGSNASSGAFFSPEAGVLFFRGNRVGHIALFGKTLLPIAHWSGPAVGDVSPYWLGGVRLMF